jgi:hypothetical protein
LPTGLSASWAILGTQRILKCRDLSVYPLPLSGEIRQRLPQCLIDIDGHAFLLGSTGIRRGPRISYVSGALGRHQNSHSGQERLVSSV